MPRPTPRHRRGCTQTPASQLRGLPDGGDDVRIGTAAADVAAHELADLLIRARPSLCKQRDRRHDLAWRAKAALKPVVANERLLHRVQASVIRQALDRR